MGFSLAGALEPTDVTPLSSPVTAEMSYCIEFVWQGFSSQRLQGWLL